MGKLYIPVAPPASGKTFYAQHLVSSGLLAETAIVSPDEYRAALTDDMSNQSATRLVFEIVDRVVEERLRRGLDVYMDATNLLLGPLEALMRTGQKHNAEITVLTFDVDEDVVRHRNATRARTVPDQAMDRMFNRLQTLDIAGVCAMYGAVVEKVTA